MMLLELMKAPIFASARMIAGEQGLRRDVESVNMMDAPDIVDFLKPGELLLTTAYLMKDDPEALLQLIANMSLVGCAGLAIKTKRFLTEVPRQAIRLAEKLHFPIIELPLDHTLGEVLYSSLSCILEKRTEELKYSLESHRSFSNLVLQGQGIPEIVVSLSLLLGSPVLLLDAGMRHVAASPHFDELPYSEALEPLRELMADYLPQEPCKSVCLLEPDQLPFRQLVIHAIQTVQPQGFLIVFSDEQIENPLPKLAVEQAVNVIRFELLKKQAVKERSRRYKNEFFADLVGGLFASEQEVLHRGKKYGLSGGCLSYCIVAKQDPFAAGSGRGAAASERAAMERDAFYEVIKRELQKTGLSFAIFNKADTVALVVSAAKHANDAMELPAGIEERLRDAIDRVERSAGISVSLGVGKPVAKLLDCPVTYNEAVEALQNGYRAKRSHFVQCYTGKDPIDLLRFVPEEELTSFYEDTFAGLERLEKKERRELLRTLLVYLDNHGQIAETAKQLFVHRNTVLYRIDKLEQLTGRRFGTPGDSLQFRIAFVVEQLIGQGSASGKNG